MSQIERVHARQILDSRGNPTVEVEVGLRSGAHGHAAVPSGASTGEFEAKELRDGGERWAGKGVTRAVANVNGEIARAVAGKDASDQRALDEALIALDGTPDKSRLGANAILGVSLAAAHAQAAEEGLALWRYLGGESARVLPVPMMNVLNGGAHADNKVDFQEFMVVPVRAPRASPRRCAWAPRCSTPSRAPCASAGWARPSATRAASRPTSTPTRTPCGCWWRASKRPACGPAMTWRSRWTRPRASSTDDGGYVLEHEGRTLSAGELADYWADLAARYPIVSIEDGMDEEDWDGWKALTERLGGSVQLVGDDLFVTNTERLQPRDRAGGRQLDPDQGQPDRHPHGDPGRDRDGARGGLYGGDEPPLGRDRGRDDRRPGGGHRLRADQDRSPVALGQGGEVQPAAADRGAAGGAGGVPGALRLSPVIELKSA